MSATPWAAPMTPPVGDDRAFELDTDGLIAAVFGTRVDALSEPQVFELDDTGEVMTLFGVPTEGMPEGRLNSLLRLAARVVQEGDIRREHAGRPDKTPNQH